MVKKECFFERRVNDIKLLDDFLVFEKRLVVDLEGG